MLLLFLGAVLFLLIGHFFKIIRWEKLIRIYEQPPTGVLSRALAIGYVVNFFFPYRIGEIFRAVYSGKSLKNGIGFSLATIVIDRFLDVVAVAVIFVCFRLLGVTGMQLEDSSRFYIIFTIILVFALVGIRFLVPQIKKVVQMFFGIFNDRLKLTGMKFCWTLINTFRDLWKLSVGSVFLTTVLMWTGYMVSYMLFSACFTASGARIKMVEVFLMFFSKANLNISSINIRNIVGAVGSVQAKLFMLYMILPVAILYAISRFPEELRRRIKGIVRADKKENASQSVLPQIYEQDQLQFLDDYFSTQSSCFAKKFIEMNRNISIIKDYSAGSNATTMLCANTQGMFYRKYAFGKDGEKLKLQVEWLHAHALDIPLCKILYEDFHGDCCCYDMEYNADAIGMFQYMHSHPLERCWDIIKTALERMQCLYQKNLRPADLETIECYIQAKVYENLNIVMKSPPLKEILKYDVVIINGKPYKNLSQLMSLFDSDRLQKIFINDSYSDIHGDLTIENIICVDQNCNVEESFYIIDPNTGNIHNSQFLDYGKLLQSLHGGYEFLMMTNSVVVSENHIDFMYTKSATYDAMYKLLKGYLEDRFSSKEMKSIFYHEIIHWLRLLPYKLRKDPLRAPMFYAGFLMVANDIDRLYP